MNARRLLGQLVFCLLLISCETESSTKPPLNSYYELLKPAECSLPCWAGIEVNKTDLQLAKELLINKYGADTIVSSDEKSLEWDANGLDGVKSGYISFYEGVVSEIFIVFEINGGIPAEELLSVLAEPTWVFVNDQPNIYCQYLRLTYPSLGIYADFHMLKEKGEIRPSSQIVMIRFLQVKISENTQVYDGYLVKWDGYKNYCE